MPMNESKAFYLVLVAVISLLGILLILPFLQYVLLAFLLAYILKPLHTRLAPRIGSTLSSLLLVIGATVAFIIPLFLMIALIAGDAIRLVQDLDPELIDVDEMESMIENFTGMEVDLIETARGSVEGIVEALLGTATDLFSTLIHGVIGIGLAAFVLFFLLKDGDALGAWLRRIIPLPPEVQTDLYERFDRLVWAVLVGHVAVAIIQGTLAGLGLWVTGVPNPAFWTFVMIILALIPLIGSFIVWAPAAVWLILTGSTAAGVGLFIYGIIIVGTSDEFLRPLIVGRVEVNPSVIIVGVIGGMYLLGFIGLFFGPVIVGSLKAILETYDEWYHQL